MKRLRIKISGCMYDLYTLFLRLCKYLKVLNFLIMWIEMEVIVVKLCSMSYCMLDLKITWCQDNFDISVQSKHFSENEIIIEMSRHVGYFDNTNIIQLFFIQSNSIVDITVHCVEVITT